MWYEYYPKAAPRPKASAGKNRKKFGETWWGKRWVDNLSRYESDQRMSRGRAYARADKVRTFKVGKGKISAIVNGSSDYKVVVTFSQHSDKKWNDICLKIRETPLLLGKLLNNEMPEELERLTDAKFIPTSFSSECSCPDYADPCKHVAAVFYTIADEIDHDPMCLFLLNGLSREELFSKLEMVEDAKSPEIPAKKVKKALKGVKAVVKMAKPVKEKDKTAVKKTKKTVKSKLAARNVTLKSPATTKKTAKVKKAQRKDG